MKQTLLMAVIVITAHLTGCSQESKTDAPGATTTTNSSTAVAKQPAEQKTDADAVFNDNKSFDPKSYKGPIDETETVGDNAIKIYLSAVDVPFYGVLEMKGKMDLGADGVLLGFVDSFSRIKFTEGGGDWKDIGRKAIKNGRLFIETKGDVNVFTIYGFENFRATIEPGIHLN